MVSRLQQPIEAPESFSDKRILLLAVAIFLFSGVLIIRLFVMQVLQHDFYTALATKRQEVVKSLTPERGSMYTRDQNSELYPLVTNREYFLAYAEPVKITDTAKFIDAVVPVLGLEEAVWKDLLGRINKEGDPYEPIVDKVTKAQKEQLEALDLTGLGFVSETKRFYPDKNLGGHIFGFVGFQEDKKIGQYGLEGYFNDELSGKSGLLRSVKDALGSLIAIGPRQIEQAENGSDIVLTVDRNIQFNACQKLKEFYDWFKAESGTVIIMRPTGAILAMCSFPDFDPEFYNEVEDINDLSNPAIFTAYEPGSVFKAVTMAAGLDTGEVEPTTTYTDEGEVKVGPYTIRNSDLKGHGEQNMIYVLEKSLNTGAIFVQQKVGKNRFRDYVKKFGFGELTGIELDTEGTGNIESLDKSGDIYSITASYGQGITVTPLQMITAFATIANNGALPKPYIVSEKISPDGAIEKIEPHNVRQVVSPKAATLLSGMLTSVIEQGYDAKAKVPGYYMAGKTGTAQIADGHGGYGVQTIHTFIGFGPVSNPQFVILIKLDKPQGPRFASDTLSPLFSQLGEYLVHYWEIPPDY